MNTVTMDLNEYNELRDKVFKLLEDLEKQRIVLKDMESKMSDLHKYILDKNLKNYLFGEIDIKELADYERFNFGIASKEKMIELGIDKNEMIAYILDKYEEWWKEQ